MALFRLLVPDQYGTYALALGVANIAMGVNDLGLVVALMRWPSHRGDAAPTATTLVLASSLLLYGCCAALAPVVAGAADRPQAAAIVLALCTLVLIDAVCAIPRSLLVSERRQRRLAGAEVAGVPLNAALSVGLAAAGWGAWAPTVGTIAAAAATAAATLWLAPRRPRPGFDAAVAKRLLRMGAPVAATSAVGLTLVNIDYLLVGTVMGTTTLGFYALAFNVSSWPSTVLTQAVRRVAISGFAQLAAPDRPATPGEGPGPHQAAQDAFVQHAVRLIALLAPLCGGFIALAQPLLATVYGARSGPAAPMLAWLAVLGACRVLLGFLFDLLSGLGRSRLMFGVHGAWLVAAVPALAVGARLDGGRGAAAAHALVAIGVALPAFAVAAHRAGVPIGILARRAAPPALWAIPASTVGWLAQRNIERPALALACGAGALAACYAAPGARSNLGRRRRPLSWRPARPSAPSPPRWRR